MDEGFEVLQLLVHLGDQLGVPRLVVVHGPALIHSELVRAPVGLLVGGQLVVLHEGVARAPGDELRQVGLHVPRPLQQPQRRLHGLLPRLEVRAVRQRPEGAGRAVRGVRVDVAHDVQRLRVRGAVAVVEDGRDLLAHERRREVHVVVRHEAHVVLDALEAEGQPRPHAKGAVVVDVQRRPGGRERAG